jgi:hypothetical protein
MPDFDIVVCQDGTLIIVQPDNEVCSEQYLNDSCYTDENWKPAGSPYRDLRSMFDYRWAKDED